MLFRSLPNVLYSVDLSSHNYTRRIGVKATQYEFNLPVSFHLPLADDYLKFSYYHYLYATRVDYSKKIYRPTGDEDRSANYIENYHKFSLHTDLAKAYESFYPRHENRSPRTSARRRRICWEPPIRP